MPDEDFYHAREHERISSAVAAMEAELLELQQKMERTRTMIAANALTPEERGALIRATKKLATESQTAERRQHWWRETQTVIPLLSNIILAIVAILALASHH